jgi:hypothetical protein
MLRPATPNDDVGSMRGSSSRIGSAFGFVSKI